MFGLEVANYRSASNFAAAAAACLPQGRRSRCWNLMGGCGSKCRGERDETIGWKQRRRLLLVVVCLCARVCVCLVAGVLIGPRHLQVRVTFIFHYFLNVPCVFSSAWVILFFMYFAPRAPVFIIIMLSWQCEGNIVWQHSTGEQRRRRTHLTVQKPNGMVCLLPLRTSDKVDSFHYQCLLFPGSKYTRQQVANTRYWYDFIERCKIFPCSLCHFSGTFSGMNKTSLQCHKCKCPTWVSARNGNIMHHHFHYVRTLNICLVGAPFEPNLSQMISVMWNLFRPFPFVLREQFAINIHSQPRSYWYKNVSNASSHSER